MYKGAVAFLAAVAFAAVVVVALAVTVRMRGDRVSGGQHTHAGAAVDDRLARLEAAAGGLALHPIDALVEDARLALAALEGIESCRFELFPYDTRLPRMGHGRFELPADEPCGPSIAAWTPADGLEIPIIVHGLPYARFVVTGPIARRAPAGLTAVHEQAVSLADRLSAGIANHPNPPWSIDPGRLRQE